MLRELVGVDSLLLGNVPSAVSRSLSSNVKGSLAGLGRLKSEEIKSQFF